MFSFLFIALQVATEAAGAVSMAPGASTVNSLAWLLAAAGLVVVAGVVWALARVGRENR